MTYIAAVRANNEGDKLYLKDFRESGNRSYLKYKSTYNDMPFVETEIFLADQGRNFVITGEDGTVLWRIPIYWVDKLKED